ncbi:MAG: MscL family protein [Devosia sp.]
MPPTCLSWANRTALQCRFLPPRGRRTAALNIGLFINAVVEFAIVAFGLFLVVKGINAIRNDQAAARPLI